jgi:hypothetical protein
VLSVFPSENVPLWLVVPIGIVALPLIVYLQLRLRRLKRDRKR